MNQNKQLYSIEAERAVLGSILLNPDLLDSVSEIVTVDLFFRPEHCIIFEAFSSLAASGEAIDIVTASEWLDKNNQLDEMGGVTYLIEIAESTPSSANVTHYAEIVKERSILRKLAQLGGQVSGQAYERDGMTSAEMIEEAERQLSQLSEGLTKAGEFESIGDILKGAVDDIEERFENGESVTGIKTGLSDLDELTGGLQDTDLIILAGRPAMGKELQNDAGVLMADGTFKKIGSVNVGDSVASIDGGASEIIGVYPQGVKQTYAVTFTDGRTVEAGLEHQWEVMYRDWEAPKIWTTEKLIEKLKCKRYQNRIFIERCSGDFGEDKDILVDPYLLGALIGDGGLSSGSVMLTNGDEHIIGKVREIADQAGVSVNHSEDISYRLATPRGEANPLMRNLDELGLMGHKSVDKFIPKQYLSATKETRIKLMQGLMDTDGTVERFGSASYSTSSVKLMEDFTNLARSLGCWAKVTSRYTYYTHNGEKRRGQLHYRINVYHENMGDFITLPRKRDRLEVRKTSREKRLNFESIKPVRESECTCIQVSHDRALFVTDDYIVTHNTSVAINMAENAAIKEGKVVAVFSLEMPKKQLANRMIASIGRLDQNKIKTGKLDGGDWDKLMLAAKQLKDAKLFIDDTAGISPSYARSKLKKIQRDHGSVDLVVIDYLQLMQIPNYREGRTNEVSEISRSLKAIAKEFDCPVIALSQLNRGLEQRTNKRPINSDLRESGAIEQDADIIMFVYRDEVYNQDSPDKGIAEIIIGKQRNGPIGTCRAAFLGQYARFENLASGYNDY